MKFLRGVARYTCTDHQHNTELRKKGGFNLNIKIQNYRNNCLQHLQRVEDYLIPKQTWQMSWKINEDIVGPDSGAGTVLFIQTM
jgi:hypothetical protein